MSLSLSFLGTFRAILNEQPLTEFYSNKVRALLVYLAVEAEQEHPRPVLAALLWPDWDDRAALGNLRFSLSKLRQVIHDQDARPPFLLINRDTIQMNPAADVSVDVHHFQREVGAGRWESADVDGQPESVLLPALEHLRTAMDLVRGGFLEGFSVGDSVAFEEWALIQRQHLEREVRCCLHGLAALYARLGDYATAELHLRRLLTMDPWDELANRRLMLVLVEEGQRTFALRHYAALQEELARELGCEPEEETQALYAHIRDGTLPSGRRADAAIPSVGRRGESESHPVRVSVSPSLPASASQFVAREWELARLGSLLEAAVTGRGGVALVAGEAGAGKTALLDEFARRASLSHLELIVLRGSCNAHGGAGDPYLPFREILQALAGDVEGKRAGGTLSSEQARRAWEALPAVGAALVEHGPDLIDTFVPGEALLRRVEGAPALSPAKGRGPTGVGRPLGRGLSPRTLSSPSDPVLSLGPCPAGQGRDKGGTRAGQAWLPRLREIVLGGRAAQAAAPGTTMDAAASRPDFFAQVTQVLHAVSLDKPLLLALDDLQWADGGTAALLFHLGRRLAGSRILLVCAYRPEAIHEPADPQDASRPLGSVLQELIREWGDVLVDLDRADGRGFVEAYLDSEPNRLGVGFRQALYAHTEGNPLFTVELLRSFERQGALIRDAAGRWIEAHDLDWDQPPARVEAIIAGHLAGLPDEDRALLQAASVQGEQFVAEVVARVLGWDEEVVVRRLSGPLSGQHRLVQAASLERLASSGQRPSASSGQRLSIYRFRHALLQGSAYRRLDAVERAWLHEATGRALEAVYAAERQVMGLAPELARHYEAAGLPLEAARQRLEAGRWAARLVAYDAAIAHLERGLTLLESVPASGERLRLELALCLALVNPATLQGGWWAPAYTRGLERLSDLTQHPEFQGDPQRLTALSVLALLTAWSADPERGRRVGEQLLGLAQGGDRQSFMLAHWVLGHSRGLQGQLVAGREHLAQALALHDPEAGRALSPLLQADPIVTGHAMLGWILLLLGHPDQGRASLQRALARAETIEQPSSEALVHLMAGIAYLVMGRDVAAALSHSQALQALGGAGLEYDSWAELLAASAQVQASPEQAGARGVEAALERGPGQAAQADSAVQAPGHGVGQAALLLVQAQLCARAGHAEMGLEAMDQAQGWIDQTGMRVLEAEVWRMRGELLLALTPWSATASPGGRGEAGEAEACFRRALRVAREQQARLLELRAAVSLARLWQGQRQCDKAHELLAGIYGWFSEGFDMPDLVEAKALLDELEIE